VLGRCDSGVERLGLAAVPLPDHPHPRQAEEVDQITGAIGGTVIDDDHLELGIVGGRKRADRLLDPCRLVVRGNHD
jgi:hypothetical protein